MVNVALNSFNSNRLHSNSIWSNCPIAALRNGVAEGHYFFDDFEEWPAYTEADDVGAEITKYYAAASDGVTITKLADTDYGTIRVAGTDADEDGMVLVYGNAAGWARFGPTDNVWFECSGTQGSVADSNAVTFYGFCEVNVVPTSVITQVDATGVLDASEDFVGWSSLQADGDALRSIYQLGGQTLANVGSGTTHATGSGYLGVPVVGTNIKWGLRWTGERSLLEFYKNGARVAYYKVPAASTTFPFVNHLAMCWAFKTTAAAEITADLDWWAGAYQSLA